MWNAIVVIYSHSDFMWKIINLMLNSKYRKKITMTKRVNKTEYYVRSPNQVVTQPTEV